MPYVTVSYAQSIDGRTATKTGDSKYISGTATLKLAHTLRRTNDAILIGINTVLRDNPLLTCRYGGLPWTRKNPVRIVLDSRLRIPVDSTIVTSANEISTIVFTVAADKTEKETMLIERGVAVERISADAQGRVSLTACLSALEQQGYRSIFVEGGSTVVSAFFREKLVQKALIVTSPLLIGSGIEGLGDLGVEHLADAIKPTKASGRRYGRDYVWELLF